MFDGLNNNRAHWNELAEVYNAKMKAIEDEKKRLEEEEARKGKYCLSLHNHPIVGLIEEQGYIFLFVCVCVCFRCVF